jgi:hypothetical protein
VLNFMALKRDSHIINKLRLAENPSCAVDQCIAYTKIEDILHTYKVLTID